MADLDYSRIAPPPGNSQPSAYKPPKHVYYGPRNRETGEEIPEPEYVYVEFPCHMYRKVGDKIEVQIADSAADVDAMGMEWTKDLGSLAVTAPTWDQSLKEKEAAAEPPKSKGGRPKKVNDDCL